MLGFTILSCRDDDDDTPFNPNDAGIPKISFVTNLAVNEEVKFYVKSKDDIEVDFGDGKKIKQTKSATSDGIFVTSKLLGKEVKIFAPNASSITKFRANLTKITSIDSKNAIELQELDLYKNELTSLDITKNTKLSFVDYSNNKIKQSASNAILNALPKRLEADQAYVWVYDNSNNEETNEKPSQIAIDAAEA
ncbi:MAG: hypothetical protein ACRC0E_07245, partial [Soonwooa sp.]